MTKRRFKAVIKSGREWERLTEGVAEEHRI
jgi:hypothetical protein